MSRPISSAVLLVTVALASVGCTADGRWDGALESCTDASYDGTTVSIVVIRGSALTLAPIGVPADADGGAIACQGQGDGGVLEDPAALTFTAAYDCSSGDVENDFVLTGGDSTQTGTVVITTGDTEVTCDLTVTRATDG